MAGFRRCVGHTRSDMDGRLIGADQGFCGLLRKNDGDLIGRSIFDLTHPHDRDDTEVDMRRLRDEGRSFHIDKRYIRSDGTVIWAEVHADFISSSHGPLYIAGRFFLIDPKPSLMIERARNMAVHDALSHLANLSSFLRGR